jgi:25S rRNA (uracil2634-N3)-methyltransferase|uniref:25S rRNA (uridine-N(3))-methyltransferase BMT5-like domain-containing protein n=1 Tax=Globisporangium ultimum (strain ATCC 200006 / CBS 805.95 / DAOM BR144) TaxID=431595 RepID=K3XBJ3_GLOUD
MKRKGGAGRHGALAPVVAEKEVVERTRNIEKLFVHADTLRCAERNRCRVCLYKIVLYGRAGLLPMVRPELCPRIAAQAKATSAEEDEAEVGASSGESSTARIGLYDAKQVKRILTVGDGNFSYSLALANAFRGLAGDVSAEEKVELVATSHESKATILETYPDGERILNELNAMLSFVQVHHEIDATNKEQMQALGKFDRVIWNFPCVRAPRGEDGQNQEMEINKKLLADFFALVGESLTPTGEIHVTHKTKPPYGQWGIEAIAENSKLRYVRAVVFDRCMYPGYSNKKVLSKGSFPIWDSQTFVFVPAAREVAPEAETEPEDSLLVPVTLDMLKKMYLLLSPTIQDALDASVKSKKRKLSHKPKQLVGVPADHAAAANAVDIASGKDDAAHANGKHKHGRKSGKGGPATTEKHKRPPQPPGKFGHQKKLKLRRK